MRIRPLQGQVLIRILPPDTHSAGGIEFPQRHLSPEEVQASHRDPSPPPPEYGVVEAIGPWPALKNGLHILPPFGVGARVLVGFHTGQKLSRGISDRLRLVRTSDVLAVITESSV